VSSKPNPNETYRQLLTSLDRAGVTYALLRDDVTNHHPMKDLDVLIEKKDADNFYRNALAQGFFLIKDGYLNPGKRVYLKWREGRWFIVDVHEMIVWRGIEFLDGKSVLARRQKANGFYRLSREDFLLSLLFHNILAKECIQEKHRALLQNLFGRQLDREYMLSHLQKFGLAAAFEEIEKNFSIASEKPQFVKKVGQQARRKLLFRRPSNLLRVWKIGFREQAIKFTGKKRGTVVTFLGPDGAGKSTTIEAIRKRLKEIGLGSKVVYLGPWGGSLLNLRKIVSLLHLTPYRSDYKAYDKGRLAEKPGPLKGFERIRFQIRSGMYYLLLFFEMRARWQLLVLPLLRQGKIVLCDRYIYDILTGYKNKPMDYHAGLRERICNSFPRPDFGILLDAVPGVIFARKPQLSPEQLQRSRISYHKIADQYGFIRLDTSKTPESTVREFEEKILPQVIEKLFEGQAKTPQPVKKTSPAMRHAPVEE
jgi:thymidylate kinase